MERSSKDLPLFMIQFQNLSMIKIALYHLILREIRNLKLSFKNHWINQNKHEFHHQKKQNRARYFIKHVTYKLKLH